MREKKKTTRQIMKKLLRELAGERNRKAQFKTVIALHYNGVQHLFTGIVEGEIVEEKQGEGGFGYDPLFKAEGMTKSFAELSLEEKNAVSHRGKAVSQLVDFLKTKED